MNAWPWPQHPRARRARHAPGAETLAQAAAPCTRSCTRAARPTRRSSRAGARDRAAVRAIALGTLRWYLRLRPRSSRCEPAVDELSPRLAALLVTAAHQIEYSRSAPEAQVHLAVDAAASLGEGARQRRGQRGAAPLRGAARRVVCRGGHRHRAARHAHPHWLVDALTRGLGRARRSHSRGQQRHPPMVLRVDPAHLGSEDFLRSWRGAGSRGARRRLEPDGRGARTSRPRCRSCPVSKPGAVSVQDCGAQLAAPLLDARRRHARARCLRGAGRQDPAHRAAHAGSRRAGGGRRRRAAPAARARKPRARRARGPAGHGRPARAAAFAGTRHPSIASWWMRPVPPPASSGAIRTSSCCAGRRTSPPSRPPSARFSPPLSNTWPGGRLLYCTCSVLPAENEAVVAAFLAGEPARAAAGWTEVRHDRRDCWSATVGWQLLPGWRRRHRWLLLCLCRTDDEITGNECIRAARIDFLTLLLARSARAGRRRAGARRCARRRARSAARPM